jgi:hypothetical protein
LAGIKQDLNAGGSGKVTPLSEAQIRALKKAKEQKMKANTGFFFGRKPPEYEVDETETDGYIYWHDGTRKTLGWVYLRFRPEVSSQAICRCLCLRGLLRKRVACDCSDGTSSSSTWRERSQF